MLKPLALLGMALLLHAPGTTPHQTDKHMEQVLIDRITVPANANDAFTQRMDINRGILKQIPGFVRDEVFETQGENGDLVYLTVAVWKDAHALKKAKERVEAEYARTGFDPVAFCQERHIKMQRGIYQPVGE